jgi:uncharacterized protein YjbI with pentapeptide repeats
MFRNFLTIATGLMAIGLTLPAQAFNPEDLSRLIETRSCIACDLSGADLSGLDLSGAILAGSNLTGATLAGTVLVQADLRRAVLNAADLSGAVFQDANLEDASLLGAVITTPASFTGANLNRTVMPAGHIRSASPSSETGIDATTTPTAMPSLNSTDVLNTIRSNSSPTPSSPEPEPLWLETPPPPQDSSDRPIESPFSESPSSQPQ